MLSHTGLTNPTLKTIYTQTSDKIRRMSDVFDSIFVKMTAAYLTIPIFVGSFITYFTTELGADAFKLPFPSMW